MRTLFSFAIIPVRVILHSSCIPREMVLLLPYLMHVSSAINPWIYGDLSSLVRSKIKKVFFKRRLKLQDGEVTVLCTYQRKSKSPEENMIAPESIFQCNFPKLRLGLTRAQPGVLKRCLIELSRSNLLAAMGYQTTCQSST